MAFMKNSFVYIYKTALCFILGFFIASCSAPRDNPLDVNNTDNQVAMLDGYVHTASLPHTALANASILFQSAGVSAVTDANGYFSFKTIKLVSGWLKISTSGYLTDSIYVDLSAGLKKSIDEYLYFIPVIDSLYFYSTVINRYTVEPLTSLTTKFKITDKDNNIDSVFIYNEALGVRKALGYDLLTKWFSTSISLSDINTDDIEKVIGKDFSIIVKNTSAKETVIGTSQIKRVINSDITFYSPSSNDTVSSQPIFTWKRFSAGYTFNYQIEVYTNEIDPTLVTEIDNISSDSISYACPTTLPQGEYFWVIWVIDEFQNRTRSKPASFLVK
jgi:hypothetical protein